MASSAKYTALDHEGLEVISPTDAPEVVQQPDERLPEVQNGGGAPRGTSEYYGKEQDGKEAYAPPGDEHAPEVDPQQQGDVRAYYGSEAQTHNGAEDKEAQRKDKRYCCGMSRRAMIILIVVIVAIVVIGAVLGGTLGTLLNKNSNNSSSSSSSNNDTSTLQTVANSGLASVISAADSEHLITYYQDSNDRVIENSYKDGSWTLDDPSYINQSVVTTSATPGSPLAAISYSQNGEEIRQIFFVTSTGGIMTTSSTKRISGTGISTDWSAPYSITNDTVAPNSVGLAACTSDLLMNGIRVFYPSQYGNIVELKYTFGQPTGQMWAAGDSWVIDVQTGLACAIANSQQNQYINIYFRATPNGTVDQYYLDYLVKNNSDNYQTAGPISPANQSIASGSDIAVASDSQQTEYVYWMLDSNIVVRGLTNPTQTVYDGFENFTLNAPIGTKLAAAFLDGGAQLMYQNSSTGASIELDNVSRYGAQLSNGSVPY